MFIPFGHDGPLRKKIEALGVPVYFGLKRASIKRPIKFGLSVVLLVRNLLNFLKNKRIQVIQSHLGQANQLAVLVGKLSGTPAFLTVHSTNPFEERRSKWDPRVYLIKTVNALIYRLAERVVTVSREIKDIMQKSYGLGDSKILVLKNGIVFKDNLVEPGQIEKEFPDSRNRLKLIAVGRLVPLKCFDVLIRAVAEIVNAGYDVLALIAGEGEKRLSLQKLVAAERILLLANDKRKRTGLSRGARQSFEREYDMRRNIKPLDSLFRRYAAERQTLQKEKSLF